MKDAPAGYTLVELVLAMLVFSVVMAIISVSFGGIVRNSGHLMKSTESDIGGLIGLELFRRDLELAGVGLPYTVPATVLYSEARDDLVLVRSCPDGCPKALPYLYDDRSNPVAPNTPSPIRFGNNVGYNGSDYLALKGAPFGTKSVSRGWCYLNYSTTGAVLRLPQGQAELERGDRVIVLRSGVSGGEAVRELVTEGTSFSLALDESLPDAFSPRQRGESYLAYGIADEGEPVTFPFNRADYYLSRPQRISSNCAPGTGVLYKSVITHDGKSAEYPLLDCVADLQAVFFWDQSGDGEIDYHSDTVEEAAETPADLRLGLKEVRVYVLAQDGKYDLTYRYPVADPQSAMVAGDRDLKAEDGRVLGRVWKEAECASAFGSSWRNYRWRLYTLVVQPRNL